MSLPFSKWGNTAVDSIVHLALSFPSLRGAPGFSPVWKPAALDEWASQPDRTVAQREAARFVLSVWFPAAMAATDFNVFRALMAWNEEHRKAFLAYCAEPFWP